MSACTHCSEQPRQAILDFSTDMDVALFDRVVTVFYTSVGPDVGVPKTTTTVRSISVSSMSQRQLAQQVLTQFQESPDSWQRVPKVLEESTFPQAKVSLWIQCLFACFSSHRCDRLVSWPADLGETHPNTMESLTRCAATRWDDLWFLRSPVC